MSRDDELLSVTLTVKQWRAIKAAIGAMESGSLNALYDELDTYDLGEGRGFSTTAKFIEDAQP